MADSLGGTPLPPGGQTPRRPGATPPAIQPVSGPGGPVSPEPGAETGTGGAPEAPGNPEVPVDGFLLTGKAPGKTTGSPATATPGPAADIFVPFVGSVRLAGQAAPPTPGLPPGAAALTGQGTEVTGQGTAGSVTEAETGRYESPEQFPPEVAAAFEAIANAPFGVKAGVRAGSAPALGTLFSQYKCVPHDQLKRAPAVFLFLNTVIGKYPPSEIRRMAEKHGVDLQRVMTALVLDPPAQPAMIARLAGDHQLGADRTAILKQAEQLANAADPLGQLAGKFTRTVLGNNPGALQSMLTDPMAFFSAQLWNKLGRDQQAFMADGSRTRKATGMLQRGGISGKGLAWVMSEHHDESGQDDQGGRQDAPHQAAGGHELQQQKAFYDNWRESLIKGIKESSDTKAGRMAGPPVIDLVPVPDPGAGRALYDPVRKTVRISAAHTHAQCVHVHTSGLMLTVAQDGELVEIALRNPNDRWELKKDLAPPVLAGLEPSRARILEPREGTAYPTHDRFFTSGDRNVIYLQVEKRPIARRALAASNVLLELDAENHLLGIVIWQLTASRPAPVGDQKAWIVGLTDDGPPIRPS